MSGTAEIVPSGWRSLMLAVAAGVVVAAQAPAAVVHLAVDVPATLGGTAAAPNQIVRRDGSHAVAVTLPPEVALAALHRLTDGKWLFAPAHPVLLGGAWYEPRDVVAFDGVAFTLALDGSTAGIPADARIDALLEDATGQSVVSFDVPVASPVPASASDLVRVPAAGAATIYWDADGPGVPASSNLVGAALTGSGTLVVAFDVTTTIAGTDYLPGELVAWNGATFSSHAKDPAWPPGAQLRDFCFLPAPGAVPDGGAFVPGLPLQATRAGGDVTLAWAAACSAGAEDYEIHEGTLGSFYSHGAILCSTGGALQATFTPAAGATYYLVVPRNPDAEGSYGRASGGAERPVGSSACAPQELATCP